MNHLLRFVALVILLATAASRPAFAESKAEFPLKDGDIWVMAGDSITAQHLHSNYFEAYCYSHYPNLKFAFRNSGVGGHTIPTTLARFDYDIAGWQPTVVSVELGMNDQGGTTPEKFVANMEIMAGRIQAIKARPVIFTASPMNNGDTMAKLGGNTRLNDYAVALKAYAGKENFPFADQFHELLDVWGHNKPHEAMANALAIIKPLAANESVAGSEHLRAFLTAQEKAPGYPPVSMQGDAVHPGPPGQLMMAAALLKELRADGFISSASIDGEKVADAKGCKITGLKTDGGKIEFDRLDDRTPFPIPDEARSVLPLFPAILDLSQYTLKIGGLKEGEYTLKINNIPAATVSAKELEAGVNLTSFGPQAREVSPIIAQAHAILSAVNNKEGVVSQWRGLSQRVHATGAAPESKEQLAALTKKVEEADEKIRVAAKPAMLHFEIAPAK